MNWDKELIPNKDYLFRWVHSDQCEDGQPIAQVFSDQGKGMSTDWSEYSTPNETQNRVSLWDRNPADFGVLTLNVGDIKKIENQIVEHTPTKKNRAHTDVFGEKTPKARVLFSRIFKWEIEPPVTPDDSALPNVSVAH